VEELQQFIQALNQNDLNFNNIFLYFRFYFENLAPCDKKNSTYSVADNPANYIGTEAKTKE